MPPTRPRPRRDITHAAVPSAAGAVAIGTLAGVAAGPRIWTTGTLFAVAVDRATAGGTVSGIETVTATANEIANGIA